MEIKLLAMDLDGTLLTTANCVPSANAFAVQQARRLGVKIAICTGRAQCEAEFAAVQVGGCDYIITCNGSMLFDNINRHHLSFHVIPYSLVDQVLEILESYDIFYQIYVDDAVCCPARHLKDFKDAPMAQAYIDMFHDSQIPLENPRADIPARGLDVTKFYVPNWDSRLLAEIRARMQKIPDLEVTASSEHSVEIFQAGMDKITALRKLVDHLGITFDNVMMVGDSENDYQAIRAAKYGVAMDNAPDFVKNAAKFVSLGHDDCGVAYAIDKLILTPAREEAQAPAPAAPEFQSGASRPRRFL